MSSFHVDWLQQQCQQAVSTHQQTTAAAVSSLAPQYLGQPVTSTAVTAGPHHVQAAYHPHQVTHQLQQPVGGGNHHLHNAQLSSVNQSPGATLGFSYAALSAATAALKASANVASDATQENDQNSPVERKRKVPPKKKKADKVVEGKLTKEIPEAYLYQCTKSWERFCGEENVSTEALPDREHFLSYLGRLTQAGKSSSWIRSQFSHLNLITRHKFGFSLKEWPDVTELGKGALGKSGLNKNSDNDNSIIDDTLTGSEVRPDYFKTWEKFCHEEGCSDHSPPSEQNFKSFCQRLLLDGGYSESYTRVQMCHLNAVCNHHFGFKPLKKWPGISKFIKELKNDDPAHQRIEQSYITGKLDAEELRPEYVTTWDKFCDEQDCNNQAPPNEQNLSSYCHGLADKGYSESYIRMQMCHINAVCNKYFGFKPLKKWPSLSQSIKEKKLDFNEGSQQVMCQMQGVGKKVSKNHTVIWQKFLDDQAISDTSVIPSESHFMSFLNRCLQRGLSIPTVRSQLSGLGAMVKHLYGIKLMAKYPALKETIRSHNKKYFEEEMSMMDEAFKTATPGEEGSALDTANEAATANTASGLHPIYLKTWDKFCSEHEVSKETPPEEHHFQAFFERMVNKNYTNNNLRRQYAHLSKACQAFFGYTLVGKFPDLMNYIEKIRRVDKKHLDQLSTMASIPKATRLKDEKTERLRDNFWERFTLEQGDFDDQHHPKETNFRVYLENRVERGITFFGVRKEYHYLNSKCFELFGFKISKKYPSVARFMESAQYETGNPSGSKLQQNNAHLGRAKSLELDDLKSFFEFTDLRDKWNLVKGALIVLVYFGWSVLTREQMAKLMVEDCRLTSKGYVITVPPRRRKRFLIPKEAEEYDSVDFFKYFHLYVRKMKRDLGIRKGIEPLRERLDKPLNAYRLFVQPCRQQGNRVYSRFPIGKNACGGVVKWVAKQLGKPDWEDYTNRSLVHRSKNNTLTSVSAEEDLDALEEDDPDSGDSVCSDEGDQLDQKGSNDNDVESEEEKPLNRPGENLHRCQTCHSEYSKAARLRIHMVKAHGREDLMPHACPNCNMKFVLKMNLATHLLKEHGVKWSDEPVRKTYSSKGPKVRCPHCDRESASKAQLVKHIFRYHNETLPNLCTQCDKRFTTPESLEKHLLQSHDLIVPLENIKAKASKEHKCHLCHRIYLSKAQLESHVDDMHPDSEFKKENESMDVDDFTDYEMETNEDCEDFSDDRGSDRDLDEFRETKPVLDPLNI